ncbi:hypothetical protein F5887DRAFT_1287425 [Amanita rubescens]|nr:hypothetical protein F5887DRAFT_1287425 [Amanita rubescens]
MDHINRVEKRHSIDVGDLNSDFFIQGYSSPRTIADPTSASPGDAQTHCRGTGAALSEVIPSGERVSRVSSADTATRISFATDLISPRKITGPLTLSPEYIRIKVQSG